MSDPLTLTIDPPIEHNGGTIAELRLREPRAGEVKNAEAVLRDGTDVDRLRWYQTKLIASVSGVPADALAKLRIGLFRQAADFLDGFTSAGLDGEDHAGLDTLELPVEPPVVINGVTYDCLALREPTLGDVRAAGSNLRNGATPDATRAYQICLVKSVSNWPLQAVELLPISVLNVAGMFCQNFLSVGLKTGSPS